jgi:hypothetical protein
MARAAHRIRTVSEVLAEARGLIHAGSEADREQGHGEARRRIAAAIEHLDAAAAGAAAEDLRLLASAVLTDPGRGQRIPGAHGSPGTTE